MKSDHANLQAFIDPKMKRLNECQARWAEMLAAFDFIIKHCLGISNPADVPSQRPDYEPMEGKVLKDILLPILQEKLLHGLIKPEEWSNVPSELGPLTISMMMCSKKAAQTKKQDVNEAGTCLGDQNTPTDENHTNDDIDILDTTVPWALIKDAMGLEIVYSDPEETITEFLLCMQSKNLGTQQLIESKGIYLKDILSDSK